MPVNANTLRVARELRAALASINDRHVRALVAAWVDGWEQVGGELDAAIMAEAMQARAGRVSGAALLRSQRLQRGLDQMATVLDRLAHDAGVTITADLRQAIEAAATAERHMIASQFPVVRPELIRADAEQIAAMLQRTTEVITSRTWTLGVEAAVAVRLELSRGMIVGDNPRTVARRMVRDLEDKFNGGLNRALVIARTEMIDAARNAGRVVDEANAHVLDGWVWTATLDGIRTCAACLGMHGEVFPLSEPGPLGHPQCRCARVPVVKSWSSLGFEAREPVSRQPDRGDGVRWLAEQDTETQRAILGPMRYEAWREGRFPPERWAVRKDNEDWRPAYYVGTPTRR